MAGRESACSPGAQLRLFFARHVSVARAGCTIAAGLIAWAALGPALTGLAWAAAPVAAVDLVPAPETSAGHAGAGLSLVPASYEPGALAQSMPSADIGTLFARYGRDSFAIGDTQIYALSVPPEHAAAVREALQVQPGVAFVGDDDCYRMQRLEPGKSAWPSPRLSGRRS